MTFVAWLSKTVQNYFCSWIPGNSGELFIPFVLKQTQFVLNIVRIYAFRYGKGKLILYSIWDQFHHWRWKSAYCAGSLHLVFYTFITSISNSWSMACFSLYTYTCFHRVRTSLILHIASYQHIVFKIQTFKSES